jgi:glycogen synthase
MSHKEWLVNLVEAAVVTMVVAAVCQELEKPEEERHWHGKLGIIPYDFRLPTIERIKKAYWNPDSDRVLSETVLGIGWAVNFYAILEKMRIISESYYSEDDFLMPNPTLRRVLEHRPTVE